DLCSGSGALALSLAHEIPGSRVLAVEGSRDALPWLRRNVGDAVEVVVADVGDAAMLPTWTARVDIVVANPPYVPESAPVSPEVRHDPVNAVFAGSDGLAVIPSVISAAGRLLRPGGFLALEHDDSHAESVPTLLEHDGRWAEIRDHRDLAGRPRYVTAVRAQN
ncbi:MAG: peptide chain release factor N(5)-glutamine methyltransferase, partial [Actinobacteria bacterium]|nr:peptide chain release factor N(5)-glutamine methyltransferase [Actinomycetota bacterium]